MLSHFGWSVPSDPKWLRAINRPVNRTTCKKSLSLVHMGCWHMSPQDWNRANIFLKNCVWHAYHSMHDEVRGQLCGVRFLLPSSCGYQVCRLVWQCLSTCVLGVFFLLVCFTLPTFWKFWSLTYISVFVWWCAYGGQKRLLDLLELILNEALSHLMWVLGCKLEMHS